MRLARNGTLCAVIGAPLTLWVALTVSPAAAVPTPATAALSWVREDGAESCADAQALRAEVNRRLGRDAFGGSAVVVSVEGVASREPAGWVAHLYARGLQSEALGSRLLRSEAATCESLSEAAALAIALVIDPEAVERTQSALAEPPLMAPPPPLPGPQPSPPAATPRKDPPGAPAWIDGYAVASLGLLPGVAQGLAMGTQVPVAGRLSVAADMYFWPEEEIRSANARFAFGLTAVSLGACAEPARASAVGLVLCTAAWLGSIHSVVFDLRPTAPGDRVWTAASALARLYVPVGRFRVSLGALALAAFTRYRFAASGRDQPIFRQAVIAGSGELGLGLRF